MKGNLQKMRGELREDGHIDYTLRVGADELPLNPLLGKSLKLTYSGAIHCDACGRKTSKSYAQGHCYPCMKKLARCDMCILKPETCHYADGTCREPDWGETHCMIPHYVYLANTSGIKVGITRQSQIPTRWIDQGATQALPIFMVMTRQLSGLVETALAKLIADKTNWRAMLKGDHDDIDLKTRADALLPQIEKQLASLRESFGDTAMQRIDEEIVALHYPVAQYPTKIASHNFDKNPVVEGTLQGIKGQYLIFDTGVINIRKFTGYEVEVDAA